MASGRASLTAKPQETAELTIPTGAWDMEGERYVTLTAVQNVPTPWAEIGFEVGFEQLAIPGEAIRPVPVAETLSPYAMIEHTVTADAITVSTVYSPSGR